ncbi:cytochrome P450 [Dietzia sp.]|uniref:cytochrome P450 n=1 Tax=Dietzia sp. TaxID=1871616 RepID=UPI002FDAC8C6
MAHEDDTEQRAGTATAQAGKDQRDQAQGEPATCPFSGARRVSGGGEQGHLDELAADPLELFWRVRSECGNAGTFELAEREVVLVSGAENNEAFFRAPEEALDQAAAYPFMTPIFGEGVVFDASPERRSEMLHNQALRGEHMRSHAETIPREVERMIADWGDEGEIDLLEFFSELTIYTSSACLIGPRFRNQLDKRFADLYRDLERGTDPHAYIDPHADIESFRRRDAARAGLVELVQGIMDERIANPPEDKADRDLLDVLVSIKDDDGRHRFSADEVTGIFISMMFAGHHTTAGTSAWVLIDLLRNPDYMREVLAELEEIYGSGDDYSFRALRKIPKLENALKESLRLHPPLIVLMRVAQEDMRIGDTDVKKGQTVAASPAVSGRLPEDFPDADTYDPSRYEKGREEDIENRWTWIPFGAGRHRCVGAAFAQLQIKSIFSILLRNFEFELAQDPDSYRNDHSKMVVQLAQPCTVRYRRRR